MRYPIPASVLIPLSPWRVMLLRLIVANHLQDLRDQGDWSKGLV